MSDNGESDYEYYTDNSENEFLDGELRIWRGIGPYEGQPTVILKGGRGYIPPLNGAKVVIIANWVFEQSLHDIGVYLPIMPNVKRLTIEYCPGIFNLYTLFMPKLKQVYIHNCENLEKINVNNLDQLYIQKCNKLDSVKLGGKVKKLHMDETTVKYIKGIIEDLCLINCNSISFLRCANILKSINFRSCTISELPQLTDVQSVHLLYCDNITEIPLYSKMMSLTLIDCLSVEKLHNTPEQLTIKSCPNLKLSSV